MKNDLIKRSALLQDIDDTVRYTTRDGMSQFGAEIRGANKVIARIESAPAVDAVEVVRCNMCLFRPKGSTYCYELERHTADGYYCAFGQLREESDEK